MVLHALVIQRSQLLSENEVSIMFCFQLQYMFTHHTTVQIKNCLKSISVIKVTTMVDFCYTNEAWATAESTLFAISEHKGIVSTH